MNDALIQLFALQAEEDKRKAEYMKEYLPKYRHKYTMKRRHNKARAVEYFGNKCCDCEQTFPDYVYDFHHLENKKFTIARMLHRKWEDIVEELAHCVMICANCHRIRHYEEQHVLQEEQDGTQSSTTD